MILGLAGLGVPLCRLTSTTLVAYKGNISRTPLKVPNLGGPNMTYRVKCSTIDKIILFNRRRGAKGA